MPSASDSVKLSWPFPNDRTISLGTSSHASAQRHCDSANQSQCFTNRSRNIQRGNFGHLKFESRDPAENSSRRRRIPFESRLCTSVLFRKAPHTRAFLQTARILRFRLNAWLGREDSNLRMAESKSAALPLGDAPIWPETRIFRQCGRTIERHLQARNMSDAIICHITPKTASLAAKQRPHGARVDRIAPCRPLPAPL